MFVRENWSCYKLEMVVDVVGGLHCRAWPLKELKVTLPLLPLVFLEGVGIVAVTITGWSEEWLCGGTGHLIHLLLCL